MSYTKYIPSLKKARIDRERAMCLWSQGKTDEEIADALDMHPTTVAKWRNNNKLPVNRKKKKHCPAWLAKVAAKNAEARAAGMTYGRYTAPAVIVRGHRG